jgi:hypothetical protein
MAEYPDNSHNGRERQQNSGSPERKLEKVVSGETKTRKKSEVKKFANIFAPENADSVKSYIVMDVVIPGIKNAIADVVSIMLFGEAGRIGGRKDKGSRISYQKYYDDRRDDRRDYGRPKAAAGFEYDDILFETRGDADLVLDGLESAIETYGVASVADLYDLSNITCRSYTANKYGWTDIHTAKVVRVRDGYILQLPRTVQLN